MSNSKTPTSLSKLQLRWRITDQMLFRIMPWYNGAPRHTILRGKATDYAKAMVYLASKGCELTALYKILDLASAIRALDPKVRSGHQKRKGRVPNARKVRGLLERMKSLAKDLYDVEETGFLNLVTQQETARTAAHLGLNWDQIDDLSTAFPYVALPKWLEKRAAMYEEYRKLASQNVPPKVLGLQRIARIVVGLYVGYATTRTNFQQLAILLECTDLGRCSAAQFSDETKEFEEHYPLSCSALKVQIRLIHPQGVKTAPADVGQIAAKDWNSCVICPDARVDPESVVLLITQESTVPVQVPEPDRSDSNTVKPAPGDWDRSRKSRAETSRSNATSRGNKERMQQPKFELRIHILFIEHNAKKPERTRIINLPNLLGDF